MSQSSINKRMEEHSVLICTHYVKFSMFLSFCCVFFQVSLECPTETATFMLQLLPWLLFTLSLLFLCMWRGMKAPVSGGRASRTDRCQLLPDRQRKIYGCGTASKTEPFRSPCLNWIGLVGWKNFIFVCMAL